MWGHQRLTGPFARGASKQSLISGCQLLLQQSTMLASKLSSWFRMLLPSILRLKASLKPSARSPPSSGLSAYGCILLQPRCMTAARAPVCSPDNRIWQRRGCNILQTLPCDGCYLLKRCLWCCRCWRRVPQTSLLVQQLTSLCKLPACAAATWTVSGSLCERYLGQECHCSLQILMRSWMPCSSSMRALTKQSRCRRLGWIARSLCCGNALREIGVCWL
mmetsp:Transcript_69551/g.166785  ORF Transcript_69551/g.166785 Transcript_69551/m.166785 type:complete len:219 (-) Transcript_69551:409-1065(-)